MMDKEIFKHNFANSVLKRYQKTTIYQLNPELINQKNELETEKYISDLIDTHLSLIQSDIAQENFYFSSQYKNVPLSGFFNAVNLLIVEEVLLFSKNWEKKNIGHFDLNNIINLLSFNIADVVFDIISRTLVLELNVKRVQNKLEGDSSEERFRYFINLLKDNKIRSELINEYPILFSQVKKYLSFWRENSSELIKHLSEDWEAICETFSINSNAKIIKIQIGAGDTHFFGKSVCILHFDSGIKVVYKPRNIDVDECVNNLFDWFNNRNNNFDFKKTKIINRKKYGWVEFINNESCSSENQIKKYHQRLGGLIFILYTLNGTDIHFENIIANGEYPVIIDLETILNPKIKKKENQNVRQYITDDLENSVLATAILPWKISVKGKFIDLSGLSNVGVNNPQLPVAAWQSEGKDDMSLTSTFVPMVGGGNVPILKKEVINSFLYYDDITKGFELLYKIVLKEKANYIKNIESFSNCQIRILLRQTETYSQLLKNSFHPDFLRDFINRDSLFDYLLVESVGVKHLQKIIDSEKRSLWQKDVPYFFCKSNTTTLCDTFGNHFKNYFSVSGVDNCLNKIKNLSLKDMKHQKWLILSSMNSYIEYIPSNYFSSKKVSNELINTKFLLELSLKVFKKLKLSEFNFKGESNWISNYQNDKNEATKFGALNFDIYDGLIGVILFLAYLYKLTKNNDVKITFSNSLNSLENDIRLTSIKQYETRGLFNGGVSGIIYLYTALFEIFKNDDYLKKAKENVKKLNINLVGGNDILTGKSGVLLSLIKYYKVSNDTMAFDKMKVLVDLITQDAVKVSNQYTWKNSLGKDICGFGHGISGIVYALTQFYKLEPSSNLSKYIHGGIAYENNYFDSTTNNWKDLREFDDVKYHLTDMTAWCTGAVGIGFSRMDLSRTFPEKKRYKQDLKIAIKKTFNDGFGHNHSLCHGDCGNLDFLIESNNQNSTKNSNEKLESLTNLIINHINSENIIYSNNIGIQDVSLMKGLSGVGYQILRLIDSKNVPSILLVK